MVGEGGGGVSRSLDRLVASAFDEHASDPRDVKHTFAPDQLP
jgi:hypothetical protein